MPEVKVPWETPLRQGTGDALAGRELFDAKDRFIAETFGTPETSGEEMCAALRDTLNAHARLVEALKFYADPETYFAIGFLPDPPCGEFMDDFDEDYDHPVMDSPRPGKRARAALEGKP